MELPLTPSARPRRAPRRSSGGTVLANGGASLRAGGAYGTPPYGAEALTGRALLRAGDAYGTSLLTGRASLRDGGAGTGRRRRRLRDEPPYGTERFIGRRLRDEPPYGRSLQDEPPYGTSLLARRHSQTSLLTNGGAAESEALTGRALYITGRRRLRDEPPYAPEAEAYGTSLLTGRRRRRLRDEPYGTEHRLREALIYTGRRRLGASLLMDGGAYGTSLLTGRASLRGGTQTSLLTNKALTRRASLRAGGGGLRDEPPYGTEALGRASLRAGRASLRDGALITGGAYGTSLLGRRRLRDEPPYGRRRLRDEPPYGTTLRECLLTLTGRVPHGTGAYGTSLLTEALTGRASLRAGGAYGTSLFTGRNYEPLYGTAPYRETPATSEGGRP